MVMTYDGALVMPSSYAVMDEEEMTYVEGGGTGQKVAFYAVQLGVNAVVNAAFGGGTITAVGTIIKAWGKQKVKQVIKEALRKWVTARVANALAGGVIGTIINFATFSVGGAVATALDRKDGCQDGEIYFSRLIK